MHLPTYDLLSFLSKFYVLFPFQLFKSGKVKYFVKSVTQSQQLRAYQRATIIWGWKMFVLCRSITIFFVAFEIQ